MSIKSIPISIAVFILTLIAFIVIFIIIPSDNCGNICGGKTIIPLIIFSLVIIIPLTFLIIKWRKDKISAGALIGTIISLIILLFLAFGIVFLSSGTRCSPYWRSTMPNINSLRVAQEMFFSEKNRYADTQEELIESGIMTAKVKFFDDKRIEKEFTDKDGSGIEGGDNDPKTWSATAYVPSKEVSKWCMLISNGYWYTCNQDGCRKEK